MNSWSQNPCILKLFSWSKDFIPSNVNQTLTQVWVRIYGLPQEYRRSKLIFSIAISLGTPICIGSTSCKSAPDRAFGHFVRVLVDIDLVKELIFKILIERIDSSFFVEVEYEKSQIYVITVIS